MELHQYAYILRSYKRQDIPLAFKLTPTEMAVHELTDEQIDIEYQKVLDKTSEFSTKQRVMIQLMYIKNHANDE